MSRSRGRENLRELRTLALNLLTLAGPGFPAPDLDAAKDADDDHVAAQTGVLAQKGRYDYPPLTVEFAWHGTAEERSGKKSHLSANVRKVIHGSRQRLPPGSWIDAQAIVEATS
jgi:hypothetical protein